MTRLPIDTYQLFVYVGGEQPEPVREITWAGWERFTDDGPNRLAAADKAAIAIARNHMRDFPGDHVGVLNRWHSGPCSVERTWLGNWHERGERFNTETDTYLEIG